MKFNPEEIKEVVSLPKESDSKSSSKDIVRYDPLQRYLSEIRAHKVLSREEEKELAIAYKEKGDKDAGYKLVVSNLRLVVAVAREYKRQAQNLIDLIQEGNIGLIEAIEKFDPYKGIRFPSYAVYWIRAYMLRYLINNLRLVKIGTTQAQRKLFFNLKKEKARLEAEGYVADPKVIAKHLGVKESEVIEMEQRMALPDLSVDAPIRVSEGQTTMHSILPDSSNLEEQVVKNQFMEQLNIVVEEFKKNISDKEKAIIELRLFTEEPETLQTIADKFNLSRERIRQLEVQVKEDLKDFIIKKLDLSSGDVNFNV